MTGSPVDESWVNWSPETVNVRSAAMFWTSDLTAVAPRTQATLVHNGDGTWTFKRYKGDKYLNDIIKSAIKKFTDTLPVTRDHFVADMETHTYIYLPTRKPWPAPSVNARIRPVALLDADGRPVLDSKKKPKRILASEWLDKNRPIEAVTWAPGEPMIIKDRLVALAGWFEHPGASVLNLYRPPTIVPGDSKEAGPWIDPPRRNQSNRYDNTRLRAPAAANWPEPEPPDRAAYELPRSDRWDEYQRGNAGTSSRRPVARASRDDSFLYL